MRIAYLAALAALAGLVLGFFVFMFQPKVVVGDFEFVSGGSETCRRLDVNFSRLEIQDFFTKAAGVSSRLIHDEFDLAPCYLEGRIVHQLKVCTWTLRPDLIGTLDCAGQFQYLLMDERERSTTRQHRL